MQLFPHLHLLVPSATPGILLEARLYLGVNPAEQDGQLPLSTSSNITPIRHDQLSADAIQALQALGIKRLVMAAHPWGKLGGNMLDP